MESLQLRLSAEDPRRIEHIPISTWMVEGRVWPHSPEGLLAATDCWVASSWSSWCSQRQSALVPVNTSPLHTHMQAALINLSRSGTGTIKVGESLLAGRGGEGVGGGVEGTRTHYMNV